MRDDLLHAQAAVDWAVAQFPSFEERIGNWLGCNIDVRVEETEPPATDNVIVAVEKELFPLSFNVEFGMCVNAIRSSLDILATALAYRYDVPRPDKAYLPIAESRDAFIAGAYKGAKFVNALPSEIRERLESLKPYKGGNDLLCSLHDLDNMRKHRRLIDVTINPYRFSIVGFGDVEKDFTPVATGWLHANEKTILGLLKGAPNYDLKITPYVAINETGTMDRQPVIGALARFVHMASSAIGLFDL